MCARGHGLLCSLAGKKEKKSTIVKCSLNPVWTNEHLVFSKTPSLEKTIQSIRDTQLTMEKQKDEQQKKIQELKGNLYRLRLGKKCFILSIHS